MTNGASLYLWFYGQEVPEWYRGMLIPAVDNGVQSSSTHWRATFIGSITYACSWKRPGASSDEDAFMTRTAVEHEVVRDPQYNSII